MRAPAQDIAAVGSRTHASPRCAADAAQTGLSFSGGQQHDSAIAVKGGNVIAARPGGPITGEIQERITSPAELLDSETCCA